MDTEKRPAEDPLAELVGVVLLGVVGWFTWAVIGVLGTAAAGAGLFWLAGATGIPDWVLLVVGFGVPMLWLKVAEDRKKAREKAIDAVTG
jgi:hypothetical protein